jgi:hypothetical protein
MSAAMRCDVVNFQWLEEIDGDDFQWLEFIGIVRRERSGDRVRTVVSQNCVEGFSGNT